MELVLEEKRLEIIDKRAHLPNHQHQPSRTRTRFRFNFASSQLERIRVFARLHVS